MTGLPFTNSLKASASTDIFQFYNDLVRRHPRAADKLAGGVSDFRIAPSARDTSAKELQVIHTDGTCSSISRKTCVHQRADTEYSQLRAAQRTAIKCQISEFRSGRMLCEHCKLDASGRLGDVDHIKSFDELAREFCDKRTDLPTSFGKEAGTNQHCFLVLESAFSEEWQAYHLEHASLRLLCIPCHKSVTLTGCLPNLTGHP